MYPLASQVKPNGHVLAKYSQPARNQLSLSDVRIYGRQVLEAISFLQEKGYVLGKELILKADVIVISVPLCCSFFSQAISMQGM